MTIWENQSLDEYLFESFVQDKVEHDLLLMMSGETDAGHLSVSTTPIKKSRIRKLKMNDCRTCPLFEGGTDVVGIPVLRCKLYGKTLQGAGGLELFRGTHHGSKQVTMAIILHEHE
jgi:hypothetical protein